MEGFIEEVRTWMLTHKRQINDNKTKFPIIGTKQQLEKVSMNEIKVGGLSVKTREKGYHQLTRIRQIRKYIDRDAAESLVPSFVASNLDYWFSDIFNQQTTKITKLRCNGCYKHS